MTEVKILIVDDCQCTRRILCRSLEHSGCSVLAASNGEEALRIAANSVLHALITDIQMPGMSGLELLREFKNLFPAIPVFLMTSEPGLANFDVIAQKAEAVLEKPIDASSVMAHLRGVISLLRNQ